MSNLRSRGNSMINLYNHHHHDSHPCSVVNKVFPLLLYSFFFVLLCLCISKQILDLMLCCPRRFWCVRVRTVDSFLHNHNASITREKANSSVVLPNSRSIFRSPWWLTQCRSEFRFRHGLRVAFGCYSSTSALLQPPLMPFVVRGTHPMGYRMAGSCLLH